MAVCSVCGDPNLTVRAWINVNTKKVIDEINLGDDNTCYCDICQAFVKSMTKYDYMYLLGEAEMKKRKVYEYEQQLYKLEKQLEV